MTKCVRLEKNRRRLRAAGIGHNGRCAGSATQEPRCPSMARPIVRPGEVGRAAPRFRNISSMPVFCPTGQPWNAAICAWHPDHLSCRERSSAARADCIARRRLIMHARKPLIPYATATVHGVVFALFVSGLPEGRQLWRKPIRKAPQCLPRTMIGEDRSFISTNCPPPMSRR